MRRKRRLQEEEERRGDREGCKLLTRIGGRQRKWQGEGCARDTREQSSRREKREYHIPQEPQDG